MTQHEFSAQMQRLLKQWPGAYSDERAKLIWREMNQLTDKQFTKVVDRLLGECQFAPLLPAFREQLAIERELAHRHEKIATAAKPEPLWTEPGAQVARENLARIKEIFAKAMKSMDEIGGDQ